MIDFTKYRKQIGILLIVMAAICSVIAVVYHRDSNLAEKDAEASVQNVYPDIPNAEPEDVPNSKSEAYINNGGNGRMRRLWDDSLPNEESLIRTYTAISKDNGHTWGAVTDITDQVYGDVYGEGTRYGLFTGSGSGVQLKHGAHAGRIMLVVAARNDATWGGTMSNYAIYSDDGGVTWHASKNPGCTDGDEAKVVELSNGNVLMSIRNRHKGDRLFSVSTDGGETWSEPKYNTTLPAPACNGDIVTYTHGGKNLLLHSLPASRTTRENVTVYVSEDNGETWVPKRCIYKGYSAYSSLQVLDDGTIGIIVEEGKWDGNLPGEDGFNLGYYRFNLAWLMEGDQE